MRRVYRAGLFSIALCLASAGCDATSNSVPDGAPARSDGGRADADSGRADAGEGRDAASSADAGVDAGPPDVEAVGCQGRAYLFCEDFEAAAPGSLPSGWTVGGGWQSGDSRPEVTSATAHTGARALRSSIAISGQRRAERSIESLGAARGVHWGRVFYRVESPAFVPRSGVVHNTMLALLGTDEARVVDTVIRPDGAHQFLYNVPDDSCCRGSSYDYRTYDGAWHCAEWQVDRTRQSFRFFIDGSEVTDIAFDYGSGDTRAKMDAFSRIALGWRNYQMPSTPYTAYFDDVAIDAERVGCD